MSEETLNAPEGETPVETTPETAVDEAVNGEAPATEGEAVAA